MKKLTRKEIEQIIAQARTNAQRPDLSGVTLRGIDLAEISLVGVNLTEADLRWANLFQADLFGANLKGADLRGANLAEANLSWANLSQADLDGANLQEALYRATTLWPAGFNPVQAGAIFEVDTRTREGDDPGNPISEDQPSEKVATNSHTTHLSDQSGLDPLHNLQAASYTEGMLLKKIFTGQLKTRNPFKLFLMGFIGLEIVLPAVCTLIAIINGENGFGWMLFCLGPLAIVGLALLINLVINLKSLNSFSNRA